jgi:diguanylate cyclase (GGDEF)-like protein
MSMGEGETFVSIQRTSRNGWIVLSAAAAILVLSHFLRQLDILLNPLAWASAEIISALLCLIIAANVLVRYHGTGNRVALLLGLTFGMIGLIHLGAIFEFYNDYASRAEQFRVPLFWMVGQTLLGMLFLVAYAINRLLPWPRQTQNNIFAVLATVVAVLLLITMVFLIFPNRPPIHPASAIPRMWDLLPAVIFLAAAYVLRRMSEPDRLAFDSMLVPVALMNGASHLMASQSARLLDAPAAAAEFTSMLSYIVLLGATLLDNSQLFSQVRVLAISDSLTGLANYRRLIDVLHGELERSERSNRSFSLLLMDLDGLKQINDQHGHLTGSRALCRIAAILRLNCRSIDTAARYGGDEFALVLPEASHDAAEHVADRIKRCIADDAESPSLSLSIGVATYPYGGATVQELIEQADRELYEMKGKLKSGTPQKDSRPQSSGH